MHDYQLLTLKNLKDLINLFSNTTVYKRQGKIVIQKMIKGEKCDIESSGLSKREWNELMDSFGFKQHLA